ncbi:hypothetical protein AJ79_06203 [Helicocarpus griseus UAMH5409]|uniref:Histone-lysine N-methyltransferase n=1 Tax=Helicocarpus griseus UAMH5409 TaxID=1447875 RepID=A0A2B7XEZ9_9EURO|nr:hypothetical protein AJ79_06203 [Helicocarpus griseus UAMH5409]
MVIDLTRDSSSEDELNYHIGKEIQTAPQPAQDERLALLQRFTRPRPRPSSSSSSTVPECSRRSASTDGVASSDGQPNHPSAVVVPSASESSSDAGIKKRRLSPANSVDKPNGTAQFPHHHGLSSFYHVEGNNKPLAYQPKREISRNNALIKPPSTRYRPSRLRNSQRSDSNSRDLMSLYLQKLSQIQGPRVHLNIHPSDASKIDFNFEFINGYKLQDGVELTDVGFHAGCSCEGSCSFSDCGHLSKEEHSEDRIVPYQLAGDGKIVLRRDFLKRKAMTYECSPLCSCMPGCWNQVVQKGRTVELEIFQTGIRGFGLRSRQNIQTGQYVDKYLGEVITRREADAREDATPANAASYLFNLDFFESEDGEDNYVVDGKRYGSITRFMNHSCNPNCRMFPVAQYEAEKKVFDLAFFAIKDIPAGTELTFDYCPTDRQESSGEVDPDAVKCLCGERNCRGELWPNQRKTMQSEID